MPNDAKLGLVLGVGLVLLIAMVFFRKEAPHPGNLPQDQALVQANEQTPTLYQSPIP